MNDKKLDIVEYPVRYPVKEKAYAFIPHNGIPFQSAGVGITYPNPSYFITRSAKNDINLFEYVISGEGEIFLDGKWQKVVAGDIYIYTAHTEQKYRSSQKNPWKKLWVNYVADYMPSFLAAYGIESGVYHADKIAASYFEELIELTKMSSAADDTAFRIADKIHKIIRLIAVGRKSTYDDEAGMRQLISTYVHKKLNLDEFANALHMSKANVIRKFKREYGITPYEYLLELKLETAKILLRDTKLTIKEIADKICISDDHYFSSLFLKKTGMRPGAYRKSENR